MRNDPVVFRLAAPGQRGRLVPGRALVQQPERMRAVAQDEFVALIAARDEPGAVEQVGFLQPADLQVALHESIRVQLHPPQPELPVGSRADRARRNGLPRQRRAEYLHRLAGARRSAPLRVLDHRPPQLFRLGARIELLRRDGQRPERQHLADLERRHLDRRLLDGGQRLVGPDRCDRGQEQRKPGRCVHHDPGGQRHQCDSWAGMDKRANLAKTPARRRRELPGGGHV
jgi:hypothetical protein